MAKMSMLKDVQSRTGTHDSRAVSLTVKDIPIGDIAFRENIRKEYPGIDELADSIRRYGLLQPITIYPDGDTFIVKTGHRRFMAYKRLYEADPNRFHSIRCVVSNAENIAAVQLVENVQREDLSQIDLLNALNDMKAQGMSNKQIGESIGKTEGYIKNLFMGIHEANDDHSLKNLIGHAGVTIQDIGETKGIPDKRERLNLLERRGKGEITRSQMRKEVKALKAGNSAVALPTNASDIPAGPIAPDTANTQGVSDSVSVLPETAKNRPESFPIRVSVKGHPEQQTIVVSPVNAGDKQALVFIEDDLRAFFTAHPDKYSLE